MNHAVILAGGSGTRLWPMSRRNRPKQLLPLVQGQSLLQLSIDRLAGLFEPEQTWVVTHASLVEPIRSSTRRLPADHVLGEPAARDTANAIGLICGLLQRHDPGARVAVFTADHVIRPTDRFAAAVRDGFAVLNDHPGGLVTLGVLPSWPHTGLGYIRLGRELRPMVHRVESFVEKPDRETAARYLAEGNYYWNSGMFLWSASTLLNCLKRFRPDHAAALDRAVDAWLAGDASKLAAAYADLPRISIDYAVMEPASAADDCPIYVRQLDCQWLDVGSWTALPEVNSTDQDGNLCSGNVAALDAAGNIIISEETDRLLAVIGIADMIVVQSGNATLIVPKSRAQEVKPLLDRITRDHGEKFV